MFDFASEAAHALEMVPLDDVEQPLAAHDVEVLSGQLHLAAGELLGPGDEGLLGSLDVGCRPCPSV